MVSETLPKGVAREIAELPDLPRDALVERWIEFYGVPPIKTLTKDLLVRAIAYEMQVQDQGGLTAAEKKALIDLAEGKADNGVAGLKPGTRLYRTLQSSPSSSSPTLSWTVRAVAVSCSTPSPAAAPRLLPRRTRVAGDTGSSLIPDTAM